MALQTNKNIDHISECSLPEVRLLTKILQAPPDHPDPLGHFRGTILTGIIDLPSRLKKPNALLGLLKPYAKGREPLCTLHQGLHPKIVHSVFTLLALEVGFHLNKVASHEHLLTESQVERVWRLRLLHLLWLDVSTFEETFGRSASGPWEFETNKCEACILTRIASNFESICDLRALILSRMSRRQIRRHGEPRLKVWVDYWMDNIMKSGLPPLFRIPETGGRPQTFEDALQQNIVDGSELKDARKKIFHHRHAEKKSRRASTMDDSGSSTAAESPDHQRPVSATQERIENGDDINQDRYDAELDIVDHYAALKSTLTVPPRSDSLRHRNSPYGQRSSSNAYQSQSSVYTNNTYRNNDRVVGQSQAARPPSKVSEQSEPLDEYINPRANWNRQSSQEHATSYQDILSSPPPTTARTVPQTARSGESIWDDAPLSGVSSPGLSSPGLRSVARGIFETLSPNVKHQSKRASEWTPMPDLDSHARDLNDNGYRTSRHTPMNYYVEDELPNSATIRHSQPSSISTKRGGAPSNLNADIAAEYNEKPPAAAFRKSTSSLASTTSNSTGSWAGSGTHLSTGSSTSVSSRYSTSAASSVSSMKPTPERRSSKLMPDFGRFKDRPSTGTPAPDTAGSNWSAFNRVFAPKEEEDKKGKGKGKGKGKEPESPRGRRSRR